MLYTIQRVDVYDNNKPVQIVADKVPLLMWANRFAKIAGNCGVYDEDGELCYLYDGYGHRIFERVYDDTRK